MRERRNGRRAEGAERAFEQDAARTGAAPQARPPRSEPAADAHAQQPGIDAEIAEILTARTDLGVEPYALGIEVEKPSLAERVWLGTEVRAGGQNLGDFGVDPWLLSVGVGRRF